MYYWGPNGLRKGVSLRTQKHFGNVGPEPKASKPWHKVVVDIVTVLVILGAFAWFFFAIIS